jgi:hypothetical protein
MSQTSRDQFRVLPKYQLLMRVLGIDAEAVFSHEKIVVWRKLADRENCTLDGEIDGKPVRLHIKRYPPGVRFAQDEVNAIELLNAASIPTVPLVGWGNLADGRSFILTEDLQGYADSEKLVAAGLPFAALLDSTADLAAKLHREGLHHRDLYLCHFFAKRDDPNDVRLIDVARVRKLGGLLSNRWIVKDLAQFWYSTQSLAVTDEQREQWLQRYASTRGIEVTPRLRSAIQRKVRTIARHDERLKRIQPTRNVSIPG